LLKEIDELPLNVKLCADLRQLDGKAERIGEIPIFFHFFSLSYDLSTDKI